MSNVTIQSIPGQGYRQKLSAGKHTLFIDVQEAKGGQDFAPDPHQLALGALGACTSITIQMYANRKGWDLKQVKVNVSEEQVPIPGQSGTRPKLTKDIEVSGNLDAEKLSALKNVAEKCPVNKLMMGDKQMECRLNLSA